MSDILDKYHLTRKPIPQKKQHIQINIPLTDERDSGYNRNELKIRILKGRATIPLKAVKETSPKLPKSPKSPKPPKQIKWKEKLKTKIPLGNLESREGRREKLEEDLVKLDEQKLSVRLPERPPPITIRASAYFMNNREIFINFINSLFGDYRQEFLKDKSSISCEKDARDFSLLIHQKIVRDYINFYTPYRGLLLYHGLGSGKTCSSIAIAEGLKTHQKVIIMTPASLRMNYIEELKKCGDLLYRFKQFWEFIPIAADSPLEAAVSKALSLPKRLIQKQKGAWLVDARKPSNYSQLSQADKLSLDKQITKMIYTKYQFINYNGLRSSHLKVLTQGGRINNPFSNKVIIIDEAHNFVSRIVNKLKNKDSLSIKLYNWLKSAERCRLVFLTGTPMINYPNELGVLFNMLRGNIKTYDLLLEIKTKKKINQLYFDELFKQKKLNIMDYVQYNSSTKKLTITRNPFGFINTDDYSVEKNEQGNITDLALFKELKARLNKDNIFVQKIDIENFAALPDDIDSFKRRFINEDNTIKNINLFKRRILGLTSYYRSAAENLMPSFDPQKDFIVEKIPMSLYQLGKYEEARKDERDQTKRAAQRKKKAGDLYKDIGSTYRIFSRLFCNFVFPSEIERPLPNKNVELPALNEDILDNASIKERLENIDGRYTNEDTEQLQQESQIVDETYETRIRNALRQLKINASNFLSRDGLQTYSPKFLKILENVSKSGLHLIYSQFRTLEGIGILKLILEENGFVEFKLVKTSSQWEILNPHNVGKPSFVLYTGTESAEEKEILRNIFNNAWDKVPKNISEELMNNATENLRGEIIKIFMITAAGAEGISLENVRYVHITEPYWHPVRVEQVIGRARRICSHQQLPEEERNVTVYMYLMTFSENFIKTEKLTMELRLHDVSRLDKTKPLTSDEALYEISNIKEKINKQLLKAVKESSMDCLLWARTGGKERLNCFSIGAANKQLFTYPPSISATETDKAAKMNKKTIVWQAKIVKIQGAEYAYRNNAGQHELYDLESYRLNQPILKGHLIIGANRKPTGVKWL